MLGIVCVTGILDTRPICRGTLPGLDGGDMMLEPGGCLGCMTGGSRCGCTALGNMRGTMGGRMRRCVRRRSRLRPVLDRGNPMASNLGCCPCLARYAVGTASITGMTCSSRMLRSIRIRCPVGMPHTILMHRLLGCHLRPHLVLCCVWNPICNMATSSSDGLPLPRSGGGIARCVPLFVSCHHMFSSESNLAR